MDRWTADRIADQSGRTFIVTGASSGLGFETSRQLAAHGGRVVMASRSQANGRDTVDRIRAAQPAGAVEFRALDLADLDSVRAFAAAILRDGSPRRASSPSSRPTTWATSH
jgi:NAD(P)-dependent dehydrogenase (short-subunit alcohol dehydrogenase family)